MPYDPNQPRVPAGSNEGGEWTYDAVYAAARKGAGLPPDEGQKYLTGDLKKWYASTPKELGAIAKDWGKKYSMSRLRVFQAEYAKYQAKSKTPAEYKAYDNMFNMVTAAIDYRAFTLNKN